MITTMIITRATRAFNLQRYTLWVSILLKNTSAGLMLAACYEYPGGPTAAKHPAPVAVEFTVRFALAYIMTSSTAAYSEQSKLPQT